MAKEPTRRDDEQVLAVLAARARGVPLPEICKAVKSQTREVGQMIATVRYADINHARFWGDKQGDVVVFWREFTRASCR